MQAKYVYRVFMARNSLHMMKLLNKHPLQKTEHLLQIMMLTLSPLNIFSIFSLSFAAYNKLVRSQIMTPKPSYSYIANRCHLCQFKQLLHGLASCTLPRVIQKYAFILTVNQTSTSKNQSRNPHMQQEKFQSLRCHCLAALGIIHQIAQVRLLNRPDVRLLAPACVAKHEIIVSLPKFIIEASNTSNRNRSNASTQKKNWQCFAHVSTHAPGGPSTARCRRLAPTTPWLLPATKKKKTKTQSRNQPNHQRKTHPASPEIGTKANRTDSQSGTRSIEPCGQRAASESNEIANSSVREKKKQFGKRNSGAELYRRMKEGAIGGWGSGSALRFLRLNLYLHFFLDFIFFWFVCLFPRVFRLCGLKIVGTPGSTWYGGDGDARGLHKSAGRCTTVGWDGLALCSSDPQPQVHHLAATGNRRFFFLRTAIQKRIRGLRGWSRDDIGMSNALEGGLVSFEANTRASLIGTVPSGTPDDALSRGPIFWWEDNSRFDRAWRLRRGYQPEQVQNVVQSLHHKRCRINHDARLMIPAMQTREHCKNKIRCNLNIANR